MEMIAGVAAAFFLILYLIVLSLILLLHYAYVVVTYVLDGKSLSAIARRRGIEKPWLAWVPVGKFWLLGAISDQYRYVVHGQIRNRRKLLLWTDLVFVVLSMAFTTGVQIWAGSMVWTSATQDLELWVAGYMESLGVIALVMFVYVGIAAVIAVFQYMAYYDLFRSCNPKKSLLYLLVSIFTTYPLPFFVFSCRNQDLGMPPRNDAPGQNRE